MNIEVVKRLLNSGNVSDRLIGLNLVNNWTFEDIQKKLGGYRSDIDTHMRLVWTPEEEAMLKIKDTLYIKINENLYVHIYSRALFFRIKPLNSKIYTEL